MIIHVAYKHTCHLTAKKNKNRVRCQVCVMSINYELITLAYFDDYFFPERERERHTFIILCKIFRSRPFVILYFAQSYTALTKVLGKSYFGVYIAGARARGCIIRFFARQNEARASLHNS